MTLTAPTGMAEFTAVAHPNIALIKYWGKQDEQLILPASSSFSLTLDVYPTTTTVRLDPDAGADVFLLDETPAPVAQTTRVSAFLDLVRRSSGRDERAVVESRNTVPTGAGLASSASGFAALAGAASAAYGLALEPRELSRLARRGSGSASRSVFGGFALWRTGDDESSFAEPLDLGELDPALVVAVLNAGPKPVSSRTAMRATAQTSPFYASWLTATAVDLQEMLDAFAARDLAAMGAIAERNAMRMHASMLGADPPIRYLSADSVTVLDTVAELRSQGLTAYATMDAGPNVKILCPRSESQQIAAAVRRAVPLADVLIAGPGHGLQVSEGGGNPVPAGTEEKR